MSSDPAPWSPFLLTGTLVFFRVAGFMLIAPVLSSRSIPLPLRAAASVLLTILLTPVVTPVPTETAIGPSTIMIELVVGFGLGLGAAVLISAAELAGDLLAIQTGLSGGTVLDPVTGQGTGVLTQLLGLSALLLLIATDGHLVMVEALARSFETVPAGEQVWIDRGLAFLVETMGLLFTRGLIFAAPIVAAVLVGYLALGVLARASPQLNMLAVAFPLQIGLGLLALSFALPLAATFYGAWPVLIGEWTSSYLTLLRGG